GDGLPDTWELAHFASLNQNAVGDFDGDGVANLDEFLDGTDPADKTSARFRLSVLNNGGLVEVVPQKLTYTNGELVTLTATAFAPEIFHGWTGDLVTRTNFISVVMTNDKAVVAHFRPMVIYWANSTGGNWQAPTNWQPMLVPTPVDEVLITNAANIS